MNYKDHFLLARYLIQTAMPGIAPAQARAFTIGCRYPDRNYLTYLRGHTFSGAIRHMDRVCDRLQRKKYWGLYSWFRFGALMHYLTDAFTWVHSPRFTGSLAQHRRYETQLHAFFPRFLRNYIPYDLDTGAPFLAQLHTRQAAYLQAPRSMQTDCRYILSICLCAVARIAAHQEGVRADSCATLTFAQQSLLNMPSLRVIYGSAPAQQPHKKRKRRRVRTAMRRMFSHLRRRTKQTAK